MKFKITKVIFENNSTKNTQKIYLPKNSYGMKENERRKEKKNKNRRAFIALRFLFFVVNSYVMIIKSFTMSECILWL